MHCVRLAPEVFSLQHNIRIMTGHNTEHCITPSFCSYFNCIELDNDKEATWFKWQQTAMRDEKGKVAGRLLG